MKERAVPGRPGKRGKARERDRKGRRRHCPSNRNPRSPPARKFEKNQGRKRCRLGWSSALSQRRLRNAACGGAAGKAYGTDGSGYALAKSLGHTVTEVYPSLVQLKTQTDKIRGLKGIKTEAEVTVLIDGKAAAKSRGDVLFTDYGVSGNAIFSVSPVISGKKNDELVLSFVPEKSQTELAEIIKNAIFALPYKDGDEVLGGIVNKRVARAALKAADCGAEIRYAAKIAQTLKNFTLKVEGTLGFDCAQVTHGGVRLTEVNPITMESKKVKGLYFSGEILDVDGDCGGFNLQWAFSSGSAAAEAIINEN